MKVFADTNFLISALATRGLSADVFQLILADHQLMTGEFVLSELERVLTTKLKVPGSVVSEAIQLLSQFHVGPTPDSKSEIEVRDEDDRWVLQSALNAGADILITGDKDLLEVSDQLKKPKILTPRQFWELVQQ